MLTLQAGTLAEVVGGELVQGSPEVVVNGLAIDSRGVEPGAAFVAFLGAHADGHDFIGDAVASGARLVVVTRDDEAVRAAVSSGRHGDVALVRVADATAALQALASYHRERMFCPVVAVTGSSGKTTTKDFLASVLGRRMRVTATEGNRNNELGVPLTIMRGGAETEVLVVEMAMRGSGQIARLCEIARPSVGLVTNVGVSHLELLGTQEAIQAAKGELVTAIPAEGAVFLNGDDALSVALVPTAAAAVRLYGLGPGAEIRGEAVEVAADGTASFTLVTPEGAGEVRLAMPGRHNVYNALAAAAVGRHLDVPLAEVVEGLGQTRPADMRMQLFTSASGVNVLNDAYNANPASMKAALQTLAEMETSGKRVAVLGDMAELGTLAELAHFEVGERVAAHGPDVLVTVGALGSRIAEGARASGMAAESVRPCATVEEASEVLDDVVEPGDIVLVKASRVVGLERVVAGIMEPHVRSR